MTELVLLNQKECEDKLVKQEREVDIIKFRCNNCSSLLSQDDDIYCRYCIKERDKEIESLKAKNVKLRKLVYGEKEE